MSLSLIQAGPYLNQSDILLLLMLGQITELHDSFLESVILLFELFHLVSGDTASFATHASAINLCLHQFQLHAQLLVLLLQDVQFRLKRFGL